MVGKCLYVTLFSGVPCISVIFGIFGILDVITFTTCISFFVNQKPYGSLAANPLFIHTMVLAYHAPCLYNIFHCHSHNPTVVHNNPTTAILLCLHNPSIPLLQPLATLHKKSQSDPCEFNDTLNDV